MSERAKNWPLIIAIVFFIAGMIIGIFEKPSYKVDKFANRVEQHFHKVEADVDAVLKESNTLRHLANKTPISNEYNSIELFKKPYTLAVFKDDSLVFWNNIQVGDDLRKPEVFHKGMGDRLFRFPNGIFYVKEDSLPDVGRVLSYLPIKYKYKLETIYLQDIFAVDRHEEAPWHSIIPAEKIEVLPIGEGIPIKNLLGNEVFSLRAKEPVAMPWVSYCLFSLYLASFLFGVIWLTNLSRKIARTKKPWAGVLLLVGGVVIIRWAMVYFDAAESFKNIPLFSVRYSNNYFTDTVGDMLINTLLSVWIAMFFFKEFKIIDASKLDYNSRFGLSMFLYSTIIGGILGITYVLKGLVLGTDIPFDFDKIGDLQWSSILSIIGILFLMLMLFLFTYRISMVIRQLDISLIQRLTALGITVVFSYAIVFVFGLDVTTLVLLLLFSIIYVISFDLYVEGDSTNLLWIVAWLVIYSAFSSSFLYKYNQMKEWSQRIEYAKFLTDDRDQVIEDQLQLLDREIKADGEVRQALEDELVYEDIEDLLLRNHSVDLRFIRYQYKLHLFVEDSLGFPRPIGESKNEFLASYDKTDITLESNLRFNSQLDDLGTYLLKIKFPRSKAQGNVIMLLEFKREVGENTRISTELFINKGYKEMEGLAEYQYAVYRNNNLVFQEGEGYRREITEMDALPEKGKYRFEKRNGKSHLIYHAWNGNLAMMNIELPNFINKVRSLNSYLFTIMVMVLGVLMVINTLLQFLPFSRESVFSPLPTLRNKIQVSVIAIIVLSFLVIGIVTIIFFEQKNDDYHQGRLGRKAKSIRGDTAREIKQEDIDSESLYKFKEIVEPISSIHRMDVNIYDLDGRLIESSGRDIYSKGLISPLMNASAFYELGTLGRERVTMDAADSEHIGNLIYDAQYEVLRDENGQVIAYIGMPYYSQKSSIQDETSDFIGTLLNVYVILLAIAGLIAIFVANSITSPLSQIGEKLKEVKIGKKNEPLEWTTKDELGALIGEYNKMIKKLDDSTRLLAQSERESAWREMAKQVAHEIKNPLTPMKLSIQYLQHAYHANPANMDTMLKRVSNTLIEQIDNLSHIATEFSNFAKMPRAENERFELNQLVQSVFDLFSEQREMDMSISLPEKSMMVFADKKQLMRVFNNLIKNAMQAIPEERRGNVKVVMKEINNNCVQLEVGDNGVGIPTENEELIFVPHITTKSKGTGLGLAISKSIIEALDGEIYFESEEGVGTSFFVEIPISMKEEIVE